MAPELKIFSVDDIRSWAIDNNPPVGLTEQVIALQRAYSILNNPYVKDDDAIVALIYEGEELAAFTASFPDMYEGKRIWWASTLWCNPKFQGQGYGLIVVGSLIEAHEPDLTFDRWGAPETVEIFKCLGYRTSYSKRYVLCDKHINRSTVKGKMAYAGQVISKCIHRKTYHKINVDYSLKYSSFVDGEAYSFMQAHRGSRLFVREQKMINWILKYPFKVSSPLINRVERDSFFSSNVCCYSYNVVKVFLGVSLVGLYFLRQDALEFSVLAEYFEDEAKEIVLSSIAEHYAMSGCSSFVCESSELCEFMQSHFFFPKKDDVMISFSIPSDVCLPQTYKLMIIDGDSFA